MIDKLHDGEKTIVLVPDTIFLGRLSNWFQSRNLEMCEDWEYYGKSLHKGKVAFGFKDKDNAMLFKLTFA